MPMHPLPVQADLKSAPRKKQTRNWLIHTASKPPGNPAFGIEQITDRIFGDSIAETLCRNILFCFGKLPGQIHHGDMDIRIMASTLDGKFSGICADVQKRLRFKVKDIGQGIGKGQSHCKKWSKANQLF